MLAFAIRRLFITVITLFVISAITFGVTEVLPGDVAGSILGQHATPESLVRLRAELGLDRPVLTRYWEWLVNLLHGDMGKSLMRNIPASPLITRRLQQSLLLGGLTLMVAMPLATFLGVVAGIYHDRWPDLIASITTLITLSTPEFVIGSVLILIFSSWLRILPSLSIPLPDASLVDRIPQLILPLVTLTLAMLAHVTRMTRANIIEVMISPFIRTAVLKGLSQREVIIRHALRNALLPTITLIASSTGYLIGGLVVVESVFTYPGLGGLLVQSILQRDLPVVQASVLIIATIYGVANLCADLLYARLDPRIHYT